MAQAYGAIYEDGIIRLNDNVSLPERTQLYVLVPDPEDRPVYKIVRPRLVNRERIDRFVKEVVSNLE